MRISVTTGPQPTSPPPPFEVISMQTLTSVKLKWKNPDYRENGLIGYIIEANNLNKKSALEWAPIASLRNGRQDRFELSLGVLSPSSQYTFRIMAFNGAGVSEPAYPNKIYGGSAVISTPSNLELRARMPYYRESWFVILCACMSVIITIMVIAFLCVRNKTYKYKKEASKNSNGSQDRLSELGFGLDDNIDVPGSGGPSSFSPLEFEMRSTGSVGASMTIGVGTSSRNDRTRATLQRGRNNNHNNNNPSSSSSGGGGGHRHSTAGHSGMINTAAIAAQAKAPPRPCPGSFSYSDEDEDDDGDLKAGGAGAFYESSGNDSLTEKPSELSSTGPDSEDSDDHDDLVAANQFVNHYANVNDTLRKGGISWKRQAPRMIVPTSSQHSLVTGHSVAGPSNSTYRPLPYPPTLPSTSSSGHSGPPPPPPPLSGSHYSLTAAGTSSGHQAGPSTSSHQHQHQHHQTGHHHQHSHQHQQHHQQPPPPPPPQQHQQLQQQLSLPQHHHSSHKSILTSASTTSINKSGHFPSRPAPPAPPQPPSYRSAMNVSESAENNHNNSSENPSPPISGSLSASQLNGGRIIVNNMAGSRAPLPGFSSFV